MLSVSERVRTKSIRCLQYSLENPCPRSKSPIPSDSPPYILSCDPDNMIFAAALLLGAYLPALAAAAPVDTPAPVAALGSKHTVYLVQCDPNECPIGYCEDDEFRIKAAAYFRDGPIDASAPTSRVQSPTTLTTLSDNRAAFEGSKRTFRLGRDGTFTSNLPKSASTASKGSIAGDATLGTEPFVCFKDGSSKFGIRYDDERYTCTTQYYCPSVDVGSTDPPAL